MVELRPHSVRFSTIGAQWGVCATLLLVPLTAGAIGCGGGDSAGQSETDKAVAAAHQAYERAKKGGVDLSSGPCVAEMLPGLDDWVVDVAHDPRQPIDDEAQNQCQRYREGEAHHFVELTPQGELIRAE
jgi:hypothetical protein